MANGNGNDEDQLTADEQRRADEEKAKIEAATKEWELIERTADLKRTEHERQLAAMEAESERMQTLLGQRHSEIRILEQQKASKAGLTPIQQKHLDQMKLEAKALELQIKLHARAAGEVKKHGDALEELNAEGAAMSHEFLGMNSKLGEFTKKLFDTKGGFKAFMKGIVSALNPLKLLAKLLTTIFESSVMLHGQLDAARMSFMAATGASKAFGNEVFQNAKALKGTGIRMAEYEQSFRALYRGAVDFTKQSPAVRRELTEMTAYLRELGVAEGDVAEITNEATRSLGFGFTEVKGVLEEVAGVANSLKMPFDVVMKDFANVSKKLAFYGKNVIGVFAKLEQQAKATGLSIDQLLGFVTQFDTFEGAGKAVGKLNAIMGGPYLNSIDMLNATEEERIEILQRSMKQAGMNFKQMGKYEQQMIAQSLGVEVAEARKLFGAETEADKIQAMEEDEIKRRQNSMLTLTERLLNIMEEFASDTFIRWMESLHSVLMSIQGVVKKFMGFFDKHTKKILAASAAAFITGPAAWRMMKTQGLLRTRMGQKLVNMRRGLAGFKMRNILKGKSPFTKGRKPASPAAMRRLARMKLKGITPGQKPGMVKRFFRALNPLNWKIPRWMKPSTWKAPSWMKPSTWKAPNWMKPSTWKAPKWMRVPKWLKDFKLGNILKQPKWMQNLITFFKGGGLKETGEAVKRWKWLGKVKFVAAKILAVVDLIIGIVQTIMGVFQDSQVIANSGLSWWEKTKMTFVSLIARVIQGFQFVASAVLGFIDIIIGSLTWLLGWIPGAENPSMWGTDEQGRVGGQDWRITRNALGLNFADIEARQQNTTAMFGETGQQLVALGGGGSIMGEKKEEKVDDFIYRGKGELGPGTITPINTQDELFGAQAGGAIEAALAKTLISAMNIAFGAKGGEGAAPPAKQPVQVNLYLSENGQLLQKFVVDAMDSDYAKKKWGPARR